jgi:hypothetical protein
MSIRQKQASKRDFDNSQKMQPRTHHNLLNDEINIKLTPLRIILERSMKNCTPDANPRDSEIRQVPQYRISPI